MELQQRLNLVKKYANKYLRRGIHGVGNKEDYVQCAYLYVLEHPNADPSSFLSAAYLSAIKQLVVDQSPVKKSYSTIYLSNKAREYYDNGKGMDANQIAEKMNITPERAINFISQENIYNSGLNGTYKDPVKLEEYTGFLNETDQKIISMFFEGNYSISEISNELGLSYSETHKRYNSGIEKLRSKYT
jgi:hypothetical protein